MTRSEIAARNARIRDAARVKTWRQLVSQFDLTRRQLQRIARVGGFRLLSAGKRRG